MSRQKSTHNDMDEHENKLKQIGGAEHLRAGSGVRDWKQKSEAAETEPDRRGNPEHTCASPQEHRPKIQSSLLGGRNETMTWWKI
jgi:hypothetical protein